METDTLLLWVLLLWVPGSTGLQDTKYVVYESVENNESMMDTFVKHPIKTGMLNGKKYMVMETTNDDYWKDFMVEGQRVRTISKDAKNNTRTIIFPYVEGKTLYDAIVKVHVKTIDYDGQYHVRIVDKEAFTSGGGGSGGGGSGGGGHHHHHH